MKYLPRLLTLVILSGLGLSLAGAPTAGQKTARQPEVPKKFTAQEQVWIKSALSEEFLMQRLKKITSEFRSGQKGKALSVSMAVNYRNELQRYSDYYFFELDTKISKRYIAGCIRFADALVQAKKEMLPLLQTKQTNSEKYRKWFDYYQRTAKGFSDLAKKPIPFTNKKRLAQLAKIKKDVAEELLASEGGTAPKKPEKRKSRKK